MNSIVYRCKVIGGSGWGQCIDRCTRGMYEDRKDG